MNSQNPDFKYSFRCLLFGANNTGKTSILNRFAHDTYTNEKPKSDWEYSKLISMDEKKIQCTICETGTSCESIKGCPIKYSMSSFIFLIAFDLTNPESFDTAKRLVQEFNELNSKRHEIFRNYKKIILIGTKADLQTKITVNDKDINDLIEINKNSILAYFPTSAKTDTNINEIFECACRYMYNTLLDKQKKSDSNEHPKSEVINENIELKIVKKINHEISDKINKLTSNKQKAYFDELKKYLDDTSLSLKIRKEFINFIKTSPDHLLNIKIGTTTKEYSAFRENTLKLLENIPDEENINFNNNFQSRKK